MTCSLRSVLTPVLLAMAVVLSAGTAAAADRALDHDPQQAGDFDFTLDVVNSKSIKVGAVGFDFVRVKCVVTNTGGTPDSYDIFKDRTESPVGWDVSICVGAGDGNCFAPFVEEVFDQIPLNPGESDTVSIYFTPVTGEDSGYADLTVVSHNDAGVSSAVQLGCVTDGCDLLIVDDTAGGNEASFFDGALLPTQDGATWRANVQAPVASNMSAFPAVVWVTGTNQQTISAADRSELTTFLQNGGRLWVSGQDVAYDLNDPGSPNSNGSDWFENTFHSEYVSDDSGSLSLTGVAGDPITDGLDVTLNGGDGANNQTDPDEVEPLTGNFGAPQSGAGVAYEYESSSGAAVRVVKSETRLVFMGFGFEAIDNQTDRLMLMNNTLTWLTGSLIGIGDSGVATPERVMLDEPRPNPFNPTVTVPFALEATGPVTLRVVDSSGRAVRTLIDGTLESGRHTPQWDGLDDSGRRLASGVYYFELEAAGTLETRKAVLAK